MPRTSNGLAVGAAVRALCVLLGASSCVPDLWWLADPALEIAMHAALPNPPRRGGHPTPTCGLESCGSVALGSMRCSPDGTYVETCAARTSPPCRGRYWTYRYACRPWEPGPHCRMPADGGPPICFGEGAGRAAEAGDLVDEGVPAAGDVAGTNVCPADARDGQDAAGARSER